VVQTEDYVQEFERFSPEVQARLIAAARLPLSSTPAGGSSAHPGALVDVAPSEAELQRRRDVEFANTLHALRQVWFLSKVNLLGETIGEFTTYPPLAEFESRLPLRPLSLRFQAIGTKVKPAVLAEIWQKRNEHIACQTVVPPEIPLDVYTLATNFDFSLARFYGEIVIRAEAGKLNTSLVNQAPHPGLICPSLVFLPNWWAEGRWLRECRDEKRRRAKTGYVVTFGDIEYYSVPPALRPNLYCRLPSFLRNDPFDRVVPTPGVFYYLWHRLLQRNTATQRMLSDYLLAVGESEWIATNAATWLQQIALGKRMMRLPSSFQTAFRQLGYEVPTRHSGEEWAVNRPVTPQLYQRLLDIHDNLDWEDPRYKLLGAVSSGNTSDTTCQWVPFDLDTEDIDWGSPSLGVNLGTPVSRVFLQDPEFTALLDLIPSQGKVTVRSLLNAAQSYAASGGALLASHAASSTLPPAGVISTVPTHAVAIGQGLTESESSHLTEQVKILKHEVEMAVQARDSMENEVIELRLQNSNLVHEKQDLGLHLNSLSDSVVSLTAAKKELHSKWLEAVQTVRAMKASLEEAAQAVATGLSNVPSMPEPGSPKPSAVREPSSAALPSDQVIDLDLPTPAGDDVTTPAETVAPIAPKGKKTLVKRLTVAGDSAKAAVRRVTRASKKSKDQASGSTTPADAYLRNVRPRKRPRPENNDPDQQ